MVYEYESLTPTQGTVYVYGINLISSKNNSGVEKFYLYNAHGDVVQLVNSSGTVVKEYQYDAFGVEYDIDENDTNYFRYTGQYFDFESGTYYLRARYYNPANGRFTTEDPIRDGLNFYTYCNNNPVLYIDLTGLIPTESEAADMAKHIYDPTNKKNTLSGGWVYQESITGGNNMVMGVYYKINSDGTKEYALVNKGTEPNILKFGKFISDWKNNLQQPFGASKDMEASIEAAIAFVKEYQGYEITMVGHSKGGAEAAANAVATNTNCIIFNPAAVNLDAYEKTKGRNYTASMTAYVVKGDALNAVVGDFYPSVYNVEYLPKQHSVLKNPILWYLWGPGSTIVNGIQNHSLNAVKNALQ